MRLQERPNKGHSYDLEYGSQKGNESRRKKPSAQRDMNPLPDEFLLHRCTATTTLTWKNRSLQKFNLGPLNLEPTLLTTRPMIQLKSIKGALIEEKP